MLRFLNGGKYAIRVSRKNMAMLARPSVIQSCKVWVHWRWCLVCGVIVGHKSSNSVPSMKDMDSVSSDACTRTSSGTGIFVHFAIYWIFAACSKFQVVFFMMRCSVTLNTSLENGRVRAIKCLVVIWPYSLVGLIKSFLSRKQRWLMLLTNSSSTPRLHHRQLRGCFNDGGSWVATYWGPSGPPRYGSSLSGRSCVASSSMRAGIYPFRRPLFRDAGWSRMVDRRVCYWKSDTNGFVVINGSVAQKVLEWW